MDEAVKNYIGPESRQIIFIIWQIRQMYFIQNIFSVYTIFKYISNIKQPLINLSLFRNKH